MNVEASSVEYREVRRLVELIASPFQFRASVSRKDLNPGHAKQRQGRTDMKATGRRASLEASFLFQGSQFLVDDCR